MDRFRDSAATKRTASPVTDDEGLAVAHTQYFRIVQPARASGQDKEPIEWKVWPPRGSTAYSFEQVLEVLRAFTQRWMETGRWPPEELEPWAEPVTDIHNCVSRPVDNPADNSWTLRDYGLARMKGLAVAANCKLTIWLTRQEDDATVDLSELDRLLIRVLRATLTPEEIDPHGCNLEEV